MVKKKFTIQEAKKTGSDLGVTWNRFDVRQFRDGMNVELEHGTREPMTNVSNDDIKITGKIALAHLNEFPDYYTRLEKMEEAAKKFWKSKTALKTQRKNRRTEYIG
ncbi:MAG: hypothetical protein KKF44_11465 [Nanoarchaeota archaeon]|nr:hypothetical protein [Nanoarchaeota archaeon]